jgi:hypothetical protein
MASLSVGLRCSVARGPKFRPHNPKGAPKKSEGPEKLVAEFLPNMSKKGRKGAVFFQASRLGDNLWIFRDECIFIPTLPSYSSKICKFSAYFFAQKQVFMWGRDFFS